MTMMRWLDQHMEELLSVILLSVIVILVCVNVTARYAFESSLPWGEELIRWVFVWFIWVAVSYVFRQDKHITITILADLLPQSWQRVHQFLARLLVVVFLLTISLYGVDLMLNPMVRSQVSVVLQMPIPVYYASAPFGAALGALRVIQNCWRSCQSPENAI
ncbi:TRAP transporter small permease [Arhodomonas sp. AD133]|uniref:TRAP transporter small permease n=1 Tax=Arhodomonas sp. AD133 TaxID=3415009 RepID=UPI003EBF9E4C